MTPVPREKPKICFSMSFGFEVSNVEYNAVGRMRATAVMIINEDKEPDTALLSLRIGACHPAEKKQQPRTKRISDRMLPSIIDWAKGVSPWTTARIPTINSTAFPKVALINAPTKSPNASDSLSDASDTAAESGMMAKKLNIEVDIEFQWRAPEVRPSGTKIQGTYMLMSCGATVFATW